MTAIKENKKRGNIFLRMHPLQRVILSLGASGITFILLRNCQLSWVLISAILWDVFAISFIITSWIIFFSRPVADIVLQANKDDGSRFFVMISILVTSFFSMFTVLLLLISDESDHKLLTVLLSVTGMMASWVLVHTIFTFHYAHLYYFRGRDDTPCDEALAFPESQPDYIDFAYFSFIIGMTFQVSDVEVNSRITRRTVLAHSLLAFALNTFVVALTINLVAGLKK